MAKKTASTKRHRWEATSDHFYPGPKYWRCIQCGLHKMTEWEQKPQYDMLDGRKWHRFAPPCPPPDHRPALGRASS
jgi:hypothetical protein